MSQLPVSTNAPPRSLEAILNWSLPNELKEPIVGDLSEEYIQRLQSQNRVRTLIWYGRQMLKTTLQFIWKTQRGLLMFLISILIFLGLMIMGMFWGGSFLFFVDVPSLMMVLIPAVIFGIGATSTQTLKLGMSLLLNDNKDLAEKDYHGAARAFSVIGNSALWSGFAATFIGWSAMGANIKAEEFSQVIGPAFAISILTIMYALILKTLCYVSEQKVLYQLSQEYKKG